MVETMPKIISISNAFKTLYTFTKIISKSIYSMILKRAKELVF